MCMGIRFSLSGRDPALPQDAGDNAEHGAAVERETSGFNRIQFISGGPGHISGSQGVFREVQRQDRRLRHTFAPAFLNLLGNECGRP